MLPRPILALAASSAAFLATSLAVTPASAQGAPASVRISYADLNLSSDAGRDVLDGRIAYAARQLCGEPAPIELNWVARSRACQREVIAVAQPRRDALVANETRYANNEFTVSLAAR